MISRIHPLLENQPFGMDRRTRSPFSLLWNLHHHPAHTLRLATAPERNLNSPELLFAATQPPVTFLRIICGVFPHDWPIEVHNSGGVTIRDVLQAIYDTLQMSYSSAEFNQLCPRQQMRVLDVYHARVNATPDPRATWEAGMKRADCLLQHSHFGGLSLPFSQDAVLENTCILSLHRPPITSPIALPSPT